MMEHRFDKSGLITFFRASRPKFLTASAAPVLVGSALGYAMTGSFHPLLFTLALVGIMALHAGANITNDYFDHLTGNDWVNKNPTPFSGGRLFIQQGIMSPRATLLEALFLLTVGAAIGVILILFTHSIFILSLGLAGLLGGYFYTARPIQLGYRGMGEFVISALFGLLPVYGSYYLQSGAIDAVPLVPAVIVSILIFLVILINEFPDLSADAAVNKKTLVVWLGIPVCVWIYRITLVASFGLAMTMLSRRLTFCAGLAYLLTAPLALMAIKAANPADLAKPGYWRASQVTVAMHSIGSIALAAGFVLFRFFG